jgi:hypothetical protein
VTALAVARSVVVMAPRIMSCCVLALTIAGCGGEQEADDGSAPGTAKPTTQLTVHVDPDGDGSAPAKQARILCDPASRERVCGAARALRPKDFEPTPADVACTQQFGGPQTATISGTLEGEQVAGRFSRQDGCEIARWDKVSALLAEAG